MSYDGNDQALRSSHTANPVARLSGHNLVPLNSASGTHRRPAETPRGWKRFAGYAVAGGIAASAVGAGLRPWLQPRSVEAASQVVPAVEPRQVTTTSPKQQTVSEVTLPATVEPFQSARLFSRVSGYVKAWHAEIGQDVKAGDVLAEIDTPELDQQLLQARADLGIARAAVAQSEAELGEALATLEEAEADGARSQADVELANTRLQRRQRLLSEQAATQEELDTALRDRDARQAERTASGASITRQKAAIGTRRAVIESRKAAVESAAANVRRLEELQSFQRVVAPFDGVVIGRTAEIGMLVSAGTGVTSDALYQLAQTDRVRVQVPVPQSEAAGVQVGTEVTVRVPEHPDQNLTATVTRTARSVDPVTRTLLAEIELPNPAGLLPPGIYAEVAVATQSPQSTWLVPTNTVRMQVEGPHVVVANERNQLEVRPVRLGRDFGRSVAVLEGVSGAERLVVNPTDDLREGTPVRVDSPASPPVVAVR